MARKRFSLNRIACPGLSLEQFFALAQRLSIGKVELRNDLAGGSVSDGLAPEQVADLAGRYGVSIIALNALQQFNLEAARPRALAELGRLVKVAVGIGCPAIVLCPNNATSDRRPPEQMFRETVEALRSLRTLLEDNELTGLVEPLGFAESSLRSGAEAKKAINEVGSPAYRIVHDTFHHALGTDTQDLLRFSDYAQSIGLVHVSGVESDDPFSCYRDPHRVLVTADDNLRSREQILALSNAGFRGPISFEPFAPEVQALDVGALAAAIEQSIAYLVGAED
ncbi:MAG: TIM barrel protein [Deltaproteobacteria bacterium]|nr:TIM barrel protein [Deltaproteobacteria bacterium]